MKNKINIAYYKTKIGEFKIGSFDNKICLLDFRYRKMRQRVDNRILKGLNAEFVEDEDDIIISIKHEIDKYLRGELIRFSTPILTVGTEFQKMVWDELMKVEYGKTASYLDIAKRIGKREAVRAVANANGNNAIAIIIPCHRIIQTDGSIGGYSGGITIKKKLLQMEREIKLF